MERARTNPQEPNRRDESRATWPDPEPSGSDSFFELPRHRRVYAAPRELPSVCSHETLDMRSVRLAPDIDPRRAPTMLSLRPVELYPEPALPPRTTSWLINAAGVLLLAAVAFLPGTLVWLVRTHRALDPSAPELQHGARPTAHRQTAGVRPATAPGSPLPSSSEPRRVPIRASRAAASAPPTPPVPPRPIAHLLRPARLGTGGHP